MSDQTRTVDLNGDLGEGFGVYRLGDDAALLAHLTSANVACGFHAGDPLVMRQTVAAALERGVAVGAHPGLPDLLGFGRRQMAVSPDEVYAYVAYQIGALAAFLRAAGATLHHVKPHGALYHRTDAQPELAAAVAAATHEVAPTALLYGPPAGALAAAAAARGVRFVAEGFADRRYEADGTLTPRTAPDALLLPDEAVAQAVRLAQTGRVQARSGAEITLTVQTLCVHGDSPDALALAQRLRDALATAGVAVAPPDFSKP